MKEYIPFLEISGHFVLKIEILLTVLSNFEKEVDMCLTHI